MPGVAILTRSVIPSAVEGSASKALAAREPKADSSTSLGMTRRRLQFRIPASEAGAGCHSLSASVRSSANGIFLDPKTGKGVWHDSIQPKGSGMGPVYSSDDRSSDRDGLDRIQPGSYRDRFGPGD